MKFKPCEIRGFNSYDVKAASDEAGSVNVEPTMTQQHFKDDCDVALIMERYANTGQFPVNVRVPTYGDYTGVNDYQSALQAIMDAEDSFMRMPPAVRLKFDNDPGKFVDFCSDPGNIEAMREMGLAVPREGENGKERSRSDERVGSSDRSQASSSGGGGRGDAAAVVGSQGGVGAGQGSAGAQGR